mmetsp:Transcript_9812/g.20294  ORF Transcript_9812/g.20294 Transcript_9812/m.20294 type:complete len:113 (-) Transcript_9812:412-750(-)|eukprot:CAMPEP_0172458032 /NCGR_PEP_ID=MMETSP1065-20121228/25636_1 /TAXON_ID=265537 /ORGANISM="Amphiprora paludosa, Strain CCMP125" /LENGTH=112 /DNA_ID=CAMNT_0013212099 /DNA_START=200 /DNA_END=538 /DNA_ORIENTATION=-
MTLYQDGEEQEQIHLNLYDDKEKLHTLFQEKGFIRKPDEIIAAQEAAMQAEKDEKERLEAEKRQQAREGRDARKKERQLAKEEEERAAQREKLLQQEQAANERRQQEKAGEL